MRFVLSIVFVLLLAACSSGGKENPGDQTWSRDKFEDKADTSREKPVSLAEYRVLTGLGPVVLVDFGAEWCPPCRKMEPVLSQLKNEEGSKFELVKIDAGRQEELMKQLGVEKIPTYIVYKNGKEQWRDLGIISIEELRSKIR